jgi:hypothetical protein
MTNLPRDGRTIVKYCDFEMSLVLKNTNPALIVDWLKGYVKSVDAYYWFEKKTTITILEPGSDGKGMHAGTSWPYELWVIIDCDHDRGRRGTGWFIFLVKPLYDPCIKEECLIYGTVEVIVSSARAWGSEPPECLGELLFEMARQWPELEKQLSKRPWMEQTGDDERTKHSLIPLITENGQVHELPWEKIGKHNWDRDAVRLWWEGYTVSEIARRVYVAEKTARNRLTILRKAHGEHIVPTVRRLRKLGIR